MSLIMEKVLRGRDEESFLQYPGYNFILSDEVPYKKISTSQYIAAPSKYKKRKVGFKEIISNIWLELVLIVTNIVLAVMFEKVSGIRITWYFYFVILACVTYMFVKIVKLNKKVITLNSEIVEVVISEKTGNQYMNQYFTILFPNHRKCIIKYRIFDTYEYENTPENTELYMIKNSNMTFFVPKYDS